MGVLPGLPTCLPQPSHICRFCKTAFRHQVLSPNFQMSLCSLSHSTYETISIISLGSLVICGVAGVALGLGIAKLGGLSAHTTIKESGEPGGAGYLSIASLGFLVSGITLAWSCAGLAAIESQEEEADFTDSQKLENKSTNEKDHISGQCDDVQHLMRPED